MFADFIKFGLAFFCNQAGLCNNSILICEFELGFLLFNTEFKK